MATFSEAVLAHSQATELKDTYIGYKIVLCSPGNLVNGAGIARVILEPGTMVFRPGCNLIDRSDLRCDKYTIDAMWSLANDMPISEGYGPWYKTCYTVGETYTADEFDAKTDANCKPGLHFFTTRAYAELFLLQQNWSREWLYQSGNGRLVELAMDERHLLPEHVFVRALKARNIAIMKNAIARGIKDDGVMLKTAFDDAIRCGDDELIVLIAEAIEHPKGHFRPGTRSSDGWSPIKRPLNGYIESKVDPIDGLYGACYDGHWHIIKYLVARRGLTDFDNGLEGACAGGRISIIEMMCDYGATDLNKGLTAACVAGRIEAQREMVRRGATKCNGCNEPIEVHAS